MRSVSWFLLWCILVVSVISVPITDSLELVPARKEVKGVVGENNNMVGEVVKKLAARVLNPSKISEQKNAPVSENQKVNTTEVNLLSKELLIENQTHVFAAPNDWQANEFERTFLSITFNISSTEDALGFDDPSLVISVNEESVYQLARTELTSDEWVTRSFVIDQHERPTYISVWVGNSGDNEKTTSAIIKDLKLTKKVPSDEVFVGELKNVAISKDNEMFSTIEWRAPSIGDDTLDKALRYELKYSTTSDVDAFSWFSLPDVEVVLPTQTMHLAKVPESKEARLIKNVVGYNHILLRAVDWQGNYGQISSVRLDEVNLVE